MIWARHRAATHWCAGHDNGSSFVTLCLGRFSLDEAVVDIDPPQQTRCKTCERQRVVAREIDRCLAELKANAPAPARLEFEMIDEDGSL